MAVQKDKEQLLEKALRAKVNISCQGFPSLYFRYLRRAMTWMPDHYAVLSHLQTCGAPFKVTSLRYLHLNLKKTLFGRLNMQNQETDYKIVTYYTLGLHWYMHAPHALEKDGSLHYIPAVFVGLSHMQYMIILSCMCMCVPSTQHCGLTKGPLW